MKQSSIAFLAAMSLAGFGCHKDKAGESLARMTAFKDQMCACKDKACSDKVSNELSRWTQEQAKAAGDKPVTPSEEDPKMEAVVEAMTSCMLKLEIPGGGGAAGSAGAAGGGGSAAPAAGSADGSAAHGW